MQSLLESFEEPSIEDIINATLSDSDALILERAIEAEKVRSSKRSYVGRHALGPMAPPQAEIDSMISLLHISYENEEWSMVAQLSLGLLRAGVDWLPFLHARLALASAFLDPSGPAFGYAIQSYQNYPDHAPAYIAMALCKLNVNQPHQALRWLLLASKASHIPHRVYNSIRKDIEWTITIDNRRVKRLLPYFKSSSYIQSVLADPSVSCKCSLETLTPILERIKDDPHRVLLERELNESFDTFVNMAGYRHLPPIFAPLDNAFSAQPTSSFKLFSPSLFAHLADFLQPMEVCRLACTCRTIAGWADQEKVWKSISVRFVGVTPSPILHEAHYAQFYKRFIKSYIFMVDTCQLIHKGMPYEDELDQARNVIQIFGAPYRRAYVYPLNTFSAAISDRIAEDNTTSTALYYARKTTMINVLLAVLCRPYSGEAVESETWPLSSLTTFVLRTGSEVAEVLEEVGAKVLTKFFVLGSAGEEACALLAALATTRYMEQQTLVPVFPSPKTLSGAPSSEISRWRSRLSGLWHLVMVKAEDSNTNKFDHGICRLDFDESIGESLFEGEGLTSLGEFENVSDVQLSLDNGSITFAIELEPSNEKIVFHGQTHSMGFGGSFVMSKSKAPSPHSPPSGYWCMAKDIRDCDEDLWETLSSAARESRENTIDVVDKEGAYEDGIAATTAKMASSSFKLQEKQLKERTFQAAKAIFTLSRPSVTTVQIHYMEEEYSNLDVNRSKAMLDMLPSTVEKSVSESPKKFARRTTLLAGISGRLLELRLSLASLYIQEFENDIAILELGPSQGNLLPFREVCIKWYDRLSLSLHEWYGMPGNAASIALFLRQVRDAVSSSNSMTLQTPSPRSTLQTASADLPPSPAVPPVRPTMHGRGISRMNDHESDAGENLYENHPSHPSTDDSEDDANTNNDAVDYYDGSEDISEEGDVRKETEDSTGSENGLATFTEHVRRHRRNAGSTRSNDRSRVRTIGTVGVVETNTNGPSSANTNLRSSLGGIENHKPAKMSLRKKSRPTGDDASMSILEPKILISAVAFTALLSVAAFFLGRMTKSSR